MKVSRWHKNGDSSINKTTQKLNIYSFHKTSITYEYEYKQQERMSNKLLMQAQIFGSSQSVGVYLANTFNSWQIC